MNHCCSVKFYWISAQSIPFKECYKFYKNNPRTEIDYFIAITEATLKRLYSHHI